MKQQDYIIILKGLLMAKTLGEFNPNEVQTLINHFDTLYQKAGK